MLVAAALLAGLAARQFLPRPPPSAPPAPPPPAEPRLLPAAPDLRGALLKLHAQPPAVDALLSPAPLTPAQLELWPPLLAKDPSASEWLATHFALQSPEKLTLFTSPPPPAGNGGIPAASTAPVAPRTHPATPPSAAANVVAARTTAGAFGKSLQPFGKQSESSRWASSFQATSAAPAAPFSSKSGTSAFSAFATPRSFADPATPPPDTFSNRKIPDTDIFPATDLHAEDFSSRPALDARGEALAPDTFSSSPCLSARGSLLASATNPYTDHPELRFLASLQSFLDAQDRLRHDCYLKVLPFAIPASEIGDLMRVWDAAWRSHGGRDGARRLLCLHLRATLSPENRRHRLDTDTLPDLAPLAVTQAGMSPEASTLFQWALLGKAPDSLPSGLADILKQIDGPVTADFPMSAELDAWFKDPLLGAQYCLHALMNNNPGARRLVEAWPRSGLSDAQIAELHRTSAELAMVWLAGTRNGALDSQTGRRAAEVLNQLRHTPKTPGIRAQLSHLFDPSARMFPNDTALESMDVAWNSAKTLPEFSRLTAGATLLETARRIHHLEDPATHPTCVYNLGRDALDMAEQKFAAQPALARGLAWDSALLGLRYYQAAPQYRNRTLEHLATTTPSCDPADPLVQLACRLLSLPPPANPFSGQPHPWSLWLDRLEPVVVASTNGDRT